MELIQWENNAIPAVICCHPQVKTQYVYSHWHKELEINYLFEGEVEFYNNGTCHVLKGGEVNIFNSKELHYGVPRKVIHDNEEKIVGITLLIDNSFLRNLIPDLDQISFLIKSKQTEKELAQKLEHIYALYCQSENLETKIRIFAAICELIAILVEKCQNSKAVIPVKEGRYLERTESIIEYLNEHYREKLQQQALADQFHFSREYFAKFFKKQTGMTLKEYITRYRLERAKDELIHKDNSILDIALQNGFSSETHFINCFKSIFGLTPLKYRKLYNEEKVTK